MNEKVLAVARPTAFTSHYTVHCSDGSLQIRTVHTCPRCGFRRLIIWSDSNSMLFADLLFGFRKTKNGVVHVQSYCRNCRSAYESRLSSSYAFLFMGKQRVKIIPPTSHLNERENNG